jgi:hypothetical protein
MAIEKASGARAAIARFVGRGELIVAKLVGFDPEDLLAGDGAGGAGGDAGIEGVDGELAVGVGVVQHVEGADDFDIDVDLLLDLAVEAGFDRLAGFAFAAGEFPIVGQRAGGLALGDEDLAGADNDGDGDGDLGHGGRVCPITAQGSVSGAWAGGKPGCGYRQAAGGFSAGGPPGLSM